MKIGDLVVYKSPGDDPLPPHKFHAYELSGIGIIQDINPNYYFIYWSGVPHRSMIAVQKDTVKLLSESS
jgi:hypothetical protein